MDSSPNSHSSPPPAPGWAFRVAVIAAIGVTLGVGGYFYVKIRRASRPPSALDRTLGVRPVPGVEESGFYNTEAAESATPFRWTNGTARLTVPFDGPAPVVLHVRLGLGVPKPIRLSIRAAGSPLFDEKVAPQTEWVRAFDLPSATKSPIAIEVVSDTFIPSQSKDNRALGVSVRGITLLGADPDYSGVNFAAEPVPGVEEGGFHNCESCGGQPCRWTNGNARVVVPVGGGRRWNALAVMAEIPNRPDYRVRLAVNGQVLFDGAAKAGATWAGEFPLKDVELSPKAVIELTSSTMAPGRAKAGDRRTLGIRLRKLMLRGG